MTRRIIVFALAMLLHSAGLGFALAMDFRLTNGEILKGEPASLNDDGLIVRLDLGGFSTRVGWGKFTQETLQELAKNPQALKFVDPFIEKPVEVKKKERAKKKEIILKPVPRVERPSGKSSFLASLIAPPGVIFLGILYLSNIFAGFEVARYRNRPPGLVCALSALFPVIGPLLFLAIPAEAVQAAATEEAAPPPDAVVAEAKSGKAPAGLGLAAQEKAQKAPTSEGSVFKRGETTFNRRFFETQFPGFFRVVPSEAEKDLVIVFKTVKGHHVGKRITRISAGELHTMTIGGGEVSVSFAELTEVLVRHKDAKG